MTTRINNKSERNWTGNNMLLKHFRNDVIVGHRYPIVSIDFHKYAMTSMMIFRQGYALVFGPSNARKPCQGRGHSRDCVAEKGMPVELGRHVTA